VLPGGVDLLVIFEGSIAIRAAIWMTVQRTASSRLQA
jgi:hypothetical protein